MYMSLSCLINNFFKIEAYFIFAYHPKCTRILQTLVLPMKKTDFLGNIYRKKSFFEWY